MAKTRYRGIAVPDPRVLDSSALWLAECENLDQAGPTAGVPEDQDGSAMVLKASGTQTASSALRLRNQVGGFPGHGHPSTGGWPATSIWQRDGDADWMGWDSPTSIAAMEVIESNVSPADGSANQYPGMLTLDGGNVLAVLQGENSTLTNVKVRKYTAATNTWGSPVTVATRTLSGSTVQNLFADLVQLPNGRVLCFHLTDDTLNPGEANVSTYYSDDEGATWAQLVEHAIAYDEIPLFDTTYMTFRRLRAAYNAATGETLLLIWATATSGTWPDNVWQFASGDGGATFDYVTDIDGTDDDDQSLTGDVVVVAGVFVVFSVNSTATSNLLGLHSIRLGSAYEALTGGTTTTRVISAAPATTIAENRVCACVDDRGVIWVYAANVAPTVDNAYCVYSGDGGLTYARAMGGADNGSQYGSWFQPGVATVYPTQMACTWQRGRVIMMCNHESPTTSTDDDTLTALYLGGFSDVTLPYRSALVPSVRRGRRDPAAQAGWAVNYLPFELPATSGWTGEHVGTHTGTIPAGVLNLTSAAASRRRYLLVAGTASAVGMTIAGCAQANSGYFGVECRHDDGVTRNTGGIRLTSTDIHIVEAPAGTPTVLTTSAHGGGKVEFILDNDAGSMTLFWRDSDSSEERQWTKVTASLTGSASAATSSLFRFGIIELQAADVDVYHIGLSEDATRGAGLNGFTNPDDLQGIPMGAGPEAAGYIADGVSVYAVDGPAVPDEDWYIDTRYEYAVERIFVGTSPSPSIPWRSSTTTASMAIAWRRSGGTYESRHWNGPEVCHLIGINWRQAQLQYTDDNGATWADMGLAGSHEIVNQKTAIFDRTGDIVYPDTGQTLADAPYYQFDELAGGYFEFPNGTVRKITSNTEGSWAYGGPINGIPRCALYLEDIDDTEDATGTGKIWFPNVTFMFEGLDADGYRLQINDDATPVNPPEGFYTIGGMFFGRIMPFGKDYSQARTITQQPNTQVITASDGTRRTRVLGKSRKTVSVSFPATDVTPYSTDGQPTSTTADGSPLWNTQQNIYLPVDEPVKLGGVLDYLRGPARPVLYMPLLDSFTDSATLLEHRNFGVIYGRIMSGVTLTQVTGVEQVSEVISIASIVIEQEL